MIETPGEDPGQKGGPVQSALCAEARQHGYGRGADGAPGVRPFAEIRKGLELRTIQEFREIRRADGGTQPSARGWRHPGIAHLRSLRIQKRQLPVFNFQLPISNQDPPLPLFPEVYFPFGWTENGKWKMNDGKWSMQFCFSLGNREIPAPDAPAVKV
jgi:hypothetical protein